MVRGSWSMAVFAATVHGQELRTQLDVVRLVKNSGNSRQIHLEK